MTSGPGYDFRLDKLCNVNVIYRIYPWINWPPILKPKNKFFLFLGKNFLEKLILYFLEFSFRYYGYMKKITASLDVKFIIACTRVFLCVLATRVSSIFFTIFEIHNSQVLKLFLSISSILIGLCLVTECKKHKRTYQQQFNW